MPPRLIPKPRRTPIAHGGGRLFRGRRIEPSYDTRFLNCLDLNSLKQATRRHRRSGASVGPGRRDRWLLAGPGDLQWDPMATGAGTDMTVEEGEHGLHRGLGQRHLLKTAIGGVIGVGLCPDSTVTISLAVPGVILIHLIGAIIARDSSAEVGSLDPERRRITTGRTKQALSCFSRREVQRLRMCPKRGTLQDTSNGSSTCTY